MRRAQGGRWYTIPPRIEAEIGKADEDVSQTGIPQAGNVLDENERRRDPLDDAGEGGPEPSRVSCSQLEPGD
jgi:hypothetical protein